tara:strand:+ start:1770 stop:2894 length:1125 start_codon:yes stop_codon:yes gene_type:complete
MLNDFWILIVEVWQTGIRGVSINEIVVCILIILGSLLLRSFINLKVINWVARFAKNTQSTLDDEIIESLRRPVGLIPIAFGFYLITAYLPLAGSLDLIATNLVKMLVIFTIFSALANFATPLLSLVGDTSWLTPAMTTWFRRVIGVIIWVIGIAMMLDVWGIEIGPIVAGLGLFSVAVALGAQDMFKNIIAGIFIISENRFQPGDRIRVGEGLHGIVENIGFRSTQLRLLDTSPIFVPNTDLSDAQVINHQNMQFRRLYWTINLLYSTSIDQLKEICSEIQDYLDQNEDFAKNPGQENVVKVTELGSSSIDIKILCYTDFVSFTNFLKIKQDLVFAIMSAVSNHGSDFAFPSRSLYLENINESNEIELKKEEKE